MKSLKIIHEYRPVLWFLVRFLGFYILGNLIYGYWVSTYYPYADPGTVILTAHTVKFMNILGAELNFVTSAIHETVEIKQKTGRVILEVFEGCNGINVMILFAAFLYAFARFRVFTLVYMIGGLVAIHLMNVLRISGLYWVAVHRPNQFYFIHKYFFTAILYVAIFFLWFLWISLTSKNTSIEKD